MCLGKVRRMREEPGVSRMHRTSAWVTAAAAAGVRGWAAQAAMAVGAPPPDLPANLRVCHGWLDKPARPTMHQRRAPDLPPRILTADFKPSCHPRIYERTNAHDPARESGQNDGRRQGKAGRIGGAVTDDGQPFMVGWRLST